MVDREKCLHNLATVPEHTVSVVIQSGVEPQADALLTLPSAIGEHIRLQYIRLSCRVPQKLEVQFVMVVCQRRKLLSTKNKQKQNLSVLPTVMIQIHFSDSSIFVILLEPETFFIIAQVVFAADSISCGDAVVERVKLT